MTNRVATIPTSAVFPYAIGPDSANTLVVILLVGWSSAATGEYCSKLPWSVFRPDVASRCATTSLNRTPRYRRPSRCKNFAANYAEGDDLFRIQTSLPRVSVSNQAATET